MGVSLPSYDKDFGREASTVRLLIRIASLQAMFGSCEETINSSSKVGENGAFVIHVYRLQMHGSDRTSALPLQQRRQHNNDNEPAYGSRSS